MLAEDMTIVVTPAAVARSAAMSLVSMPPVPRAVPRDFVETVVSRQGRGCCIDRGRMEDKADNKKLYVKQKHYG
jgi:hypothetical protein